MITSHALGWHLEEEFAEFERVVKEGGYIIHCPGPADKASELTSPPWNYCSAKYYEADGPKRK